MISVIAILVIVSAVAYNGVQRNAADVSLRSDVENAQGAVASYSSKNAGVYGSGVVWYSGGSANPNIPVTASGENEIDIVATTEYYCIRGHASGSTWNTIETSLTEDGGTGGCAALDASPTAGGSGGNNLLAWWKFNGNASDSGPNGQTGTLAGSTLPTLTTGQNSSSNNAYSFPGTNSQINVTDTVTVSPTGAMSLSAWVKFGGLSAGEIRGIVSKDVSGGTTNPPYSLELTTSDQLQARVTTSSDTSRTITCSSLTVSTGTWYHLLLTYDVAVTLYVNGASCGTSAGAADIADTTGPLRFGQQKNGSNRWLNGSIDDVRLYSKTLSAEEAVSIYEAGAR